MYRRQNIFLIGPMGAGKTSIGKKLAKTLGWDFYDVDEEIEKHTGVSIPWIFDVEGEAGFRLREQKVIDIFTHKKQIVLATGGGAVLMEENRKVLRTRGLVIYLKASVAEQLQRTKKSHHRPLLQVGDPEAKLLELKEKRDALYEATADFIAVTDNHALGDIITDIMNYLRETK